ncbi:unnamed protein product [Didymodactylos carnosus]|nr:unnamed protein product [Didymodactylos carnosus]CAF3516384.1 unnamed protein product [Didymodactylos carnosus]
MLTSSRNNVSLHTSVDIDQLTKRTVVSAADSNNSIENAYSLDHLFLSFHKRIGRINDSYSVSTLHYALKAASRLFNTYQNISLSVVDEFVRRLKKIKEKKVCGHLKQFLKLIEYLRKCHETLKNELLVTTLALDFNEDILTKKNDDTNLLAISGKFSPKSRMSKYRLHYAQHALKIKEELKAVNEKLVNLLNDEYDANMNLLYDQSEKALSGLTYYNSGMAYILRLIPDIALKFETILRLCTQLFDLESTIQLQLPPIEDSRLNQYTSPIALSADITPRSTLTHSDRHLSILPHDLQASNNNLSVDSNSQSNHFLVLPSNINTHQSSVLPVQQTFAFSTDATTGQSRLPTTTINLNALKTLNSHQKQQQQQSRPSISSSLSSTNVTSSSSTEQIPFLNQTDISPYTINNKSNDIIATVKQDTSMNVLITGLRCRLQEEVARLTSLLECYQKAPEAVERFRIICRRISEIERSMIDLKIDYDNKGDAESETTSTQAIYSRHPQVILARELLLAKYRKNLYMTDYRAHASVQGELEIAIREVKSKIEWLQMALQRAVQSL